jgi:tRNA-uridine 2-sulfurtransferase
VMTPGEIVDGGGRLLGHHQGAAAFTVGQRRGLGVATGERRYVIDVDAPSNRVTVGPAEDLLRDGVTLVDLCFVDGRPSASEALAVQSRAHGRPVPGRLAGDVVRFDRPQPRVAPGQVVALYRDDELVGGGIAV